VKKLDQILKTDMKREQLSSFEKSFGYRLKKMTDDSEMFINAPNVDEEFKADAANF
jgi:hypothetical protein